MAQETKSSAPVAVAAPAAPAPPAPEVVVVPVVAEKSAAAVPEKPASPVVEKEVSSDVPVASPKKPEVVEKEIAAPEPETLEKPVAAEEEVVDAEKDGSKVAESVSFKEESNVVADLPNPQQKALDELKKLVQEALNKHELTAPPPPPPVKEEEKKPEAEATPAPVEEESKAEEKKESETVPESKPEEKKEAETTTPAVVAPVEVAPPAKEEPKPEPEKVVETKVEEKTTPPPPPTVEPVVVEKVEQKVKVIEDDVTKTVEEIKETIVEVTTSAAAPPPPTVEETPKEETTEAPETDAPPPTPEEVSIWGIKLMEDEKTDTILLKFLRARDFKVKEAFAMLKSVIAWRKQFKIDELIEEENISEGLEKVVYLHGKDKEGHQVIYNAFGEFQDKELYQNTFADAEKRSKFLRGTIQFLEKSIRNLDFTPDGLSTLFQVIDLKNSPGLFFYKKDLRYAINQALQLFQDNYPEFVAKQVYINVPWWYPSYYRMTNAIFTSRTKSKFVFAGPSKSAETLFKYIAPELVPVQYGGLSRDVDPQEFTTADAATEETVKPASKHKFEFEVAENSTLVWELRVIGWDVTYGAEFVPAAEEGYTVIIQKSRKILPSDEPIISTSYKTNEPGKVVLTIDNQTSKRKKVLYRSKNKPSSD